MNSTESTIQAEPRLSYTAADLAKTLGISRVTLWRLHKTGKLLPVSGLRRRLYSRAAVEKFLASTGE